MSPPHDSSDSEGADTEEVSSQDAESGDETDTLPGHDDEELPATDTTHANKCVAPQTTLSNGDISEEAAHMTFGPEDDTQTSLAQHDDVIV